jgi:F-type H+-transporting ATPase subunit b
MPQINQLADAAYSQFFWLLLVLALIYFGIGKAMLPKIQSTVDLREKRVADDLAAAQAARGAADETEAAYRARMDASRAEALKLAQEAKATGARETEEKSKATAVELDARIGAAETRIAEARDSALADIESVAAEAARDIVVHLAGVQVSDAKAKKAVKAAMSNG